MATAPTRFVLYVQLEPLQLNPPVWRRMVVSGDATLRKLHHFIQAAMGWSSKHLYEFDLNEQRYGPPDREFPDPRLCDDRKFKLSRVLNVGDRLRYTYDFGDSWQHVIAVEAQEPDQSTGSWCEVLGGERACPPEDCGGVAMYQDMLALLKRTPNDEEAQAFVQWAGEGFDPETFDPRAASAATQRICNNFWG
ncbi:plasmid pRiA4b ORF-3 family protein [Pseudomonas sp. RIT-PI-S]|uniref:plasmid pRiA4b ORF-3 family protein n=1 Tax=Pseudomonas sp. RIT-PI-S TaxID=3035295 RepID=UPI0021D9BA01|nr:plasmid pRiA4b ORF-3 family protein [Pseudomonas sp. RIT-PI-S]